VLEKRRWDSDKDVLPAPGMALLDTLGFPWTGQQKILVTEECLEAGGPMYVVGTLEQRRHLPSGQPGVAERVKTALRTGGWRRAVVGALPRSMRVVAAVFIGYLDMLIGMSIARTRPQLAEDLAPPSMAPDERLIWKGRDGHPFIVSDQNEEDALAGLRKRSMIVGGMGLAIACFAFYTLVEAL
jgi:hypothetical protein